ncbi:MAG: penicillin-binding protein 1C [Candidatus Binatia bacterium]
MSKIIMFLWAAGVIVGVVWLWPLPVVPTFQKVVAAYRPSDTPLLDRSGAILHEMRIDMQRRRFAWTPLREISPAVLDIVVESEDRRFYRHAGVDWRAIAGVTLRRLTGRPLRGASTISMQAASLLEAQDSPRQKIGRTRTFFSLFSYKWRQIRRAWALEKSWAKKEILETYLNLAPFRGELEGITAASYLLFNKAPHGITEAEAIALAVMLRAPNAPAEALFHRARAFSTKKNFTVTHEEVAEAVTQTLHASTNAPVRIALAPHVARRLLSGTQDAPIRSSLDRRVQRFVWEALRRHLLAVREQRVEDGAVLVVENVSGEVLAYVGGSGDLSSAPYVDGVVARRQAGSTLKPFLYGLALDQRLLTPASLLEDTPLDLAVSGGVYRPRNYDEQFKGLVSVRTALASSLNVPAVRTLSLVGADAFVQQLHALGFRGLAEAGDFYGPSLALGSADVNLWELVNAYRTLANGGEQGWLRMTTEEVESQKSEVGSRKLDSEHRLYSEETAFLVSHILSDRESRSATFGLENSLATSFWSAVKTGTSKDMRDNWCVGYSRRFTVGVWVGNFSGAPMKNVSGVTGAAPVWAEVIEWLQRNLPQGAPTPPGGMIAREVIFPNETEPPRVEWFLRGSEPQPATRQLAREQGRILAPTDGVILALDPDIPPTRQRVIFAAVRVSASARWLLDGVGIGTATAPFLWDPIPGKHILLLIDEEHAVIDQIAFSVRGRKRDSE